MPVIVGKRILRIARVLIWRLILLTRVEEVRLAWRIAITRVTGLLWWDVLIMQGAWGGRKQRVVSILLKV